MKHQFLKLTAAAVLAGATAMAQTPAPAESAQPGMRQHAFKRGMARQRMMQALNLTDSQKQQAKAIFQQTRENTKPIVDELKTNRQALSAAIKANDVGQIHSLSAKQGKLRGQILAARSEGKAKFYALLTPDQKAKADQMHAQFRQKMQQRMQQRNQSGE
jgi:Spy/CpxP family protein refolding chaperone